MDGVVINWWAVLLAAASTMAVGSVWYTPKVFGNTWAQLARVDKKKLEKSGWAPLMFALVGSLVTAYILAHFAYIAHDYFGNSFFWDTLCVALWGWLGFAALRFMTHDVFEGRPGKLTLINAAHELVTFVVMGLIIGAMGV